MGIKLDEYFKTELRYLEIALNNETDLIQRSNICWYTLQRCLGASQFAELCGVPYSLIEAMYEGVRQKVNEMEKGA